MNTFYLTDKLVESANFFYDYVKSVWQLICIVYFNALPDSWSGHPLVPLRSLRLRFKTSRTIHIVSTRGRPNGFVSRGHLNRPASLAAVRFQSPPRSVAETKVFPTNARADRINGVQVAKIKRKRTARVRQDYWCRSGIWCRRRCGVRSTRPATITTRHCRRRERP